MWCKEILGAILVAAATCAFPIQSYAQIGSYTICIGDSCVIGVRGSATFNLPCYADEASTARTSCLKKGQSYVDHSRYNVESGGKCGRIYLEVFCK